MRYIKILLVKRKCFFFFYRCKHHIWHFRGSNFAVRIHIFGHFVLHELCRWITRMFRLGQRLRIIFIMLTLTKSLVSYFLSIYSVRRRFLLGWSKQSMHCVDRLSSRTLDRPRYFDDNSLIIRFDCRRSDCFG